MRRVSEKKLLVGLAATAGIVLLAANGLDAHKGITSKYTYDDDVFPILRDKCGTCHVEGGAAPMSLMVYTPNGGAVAWAESIREMLLTEAMPPWYADPTGPAIRGARSLSARELDVIVTWATGGTPEGNLNHRPMPMTAHARWTLGKPDITLPLPKEVSLGPGQMEDIADFTVPTGLTETRWVKAADLLPGTPSMVRSASISIEDGPVLALWEPGDEALPAPSGAAFKLQAGAKLHIHIRYKKSWQEERDTKTDRSAVGLYFTDEPLSGKDIQALVLDGPSDAGDATHPRSFSVTMTRNGRVLAVRPLVDQPYASVSVTAVTSSGRALLLRLRGVRPEWPRRYWLADPIEVPSGATIEVAAIPGDPNAGPLAAPVKSPLQVALDVVQP